MRVCSMFLCVLFLVTSALAVPTVEQTVAEVFQQAATEHVALPAPNLEQQQGHITVPTPAFETWSLGTLRVRDLSANGLPNLYSHVVLSRSAAMEGLVQRVQQMQIAGEGKAVNAYCRAASSFLADKDPRQRALACELLAHSPATTTELDLLPEIGKLLDDTAAAFPAAAKGPGPQSITSAPVNDIRPVAAVTVGEMAQLTMMIATQARFSTGADFQYWWAENKNFRHHLWYWVTRASFPPTDTATLQALGAREVVRISLLVNNSTARRYEREAPWRRHGKQPPAGISDTVYYLHINVDYAEVRRLVKAQALQPWLLDVLAGNEVWPEVDDKQGGGARMLGYSIVEALRDTLQRKDAATLVAILNSNRGLAAKSTDLQTRMTEMAVGLDRERLAPIILQQLERNPKQPRLACMLLANSGMQHWPVVERLYREQFDARGQAEIINTLGELGAKAAYRDALVQLFTTDHLEPIFAADGRRADEDYSRGIRLFAYSNAAKHLNGGKPVVDDDLLQAATWHDGKVSREEAEARERAVPVARKEAIARLAAFFAK